jgi:hypothetical protein
MTDKKEALNLLLLLSQIEGWSFGCNQIMPDHIIERLDNAVDALTKIILEGKANE